VLWLRSGVSSPGAARPPTRVDSADDNAPQPRLREGGGTTGRPGCARGSSSVGRVTTGGAGGRTHSVPSGPCPFERHE
jgi:hypothetical protein